MQQQQRHDNDTAGVMQAVDAARLGSQDPGGGGPAPAGNPSGMMAGRQQGREGRSTSCGNRASFKREP